MNIRQLITTASPHRVCEIYEQAYRDDGWNKVETYREFLDRIGKLVPVSTGDHTVIVKEVGDEQWDVLMIDEKGDKYSLSLTPWEEWIAMKVEVGDMHVDEAAAHVYWEMTWHGWPEGQEEVRDRLKDQMEKIERLMESGDDPEDHGYTVYKPKGAD